MGCRPRPGGRGAGRVWVLAAGGGGGGGGAGGVVAGGVSRLRPPRVRRPRSVAARLAGSERGATGRSPIGRATKGSLADVRPEDLLGTVMKAVVERSGVDPKDIDDVVTGSVGGAQINIARSGALLAGIPESVPATTVNRYCSSSLQAT